MSKPFCGTSDEWNAKIRKDFKNHACVKLVTDYNDQEWAEYIKNSYTYKEIMRIK